MQFGTGSNSVFIIRSTMRKSTGISRPSSSVYIDHETVNQSVRYSDKATHKKGLFPVQRVAKIMATQAAANAFSFLFLLKNLPPKKDKLGKCHLVNIGPNHKQ